MVGVWTRAVVVRVRLTVLRAALRCCLEYGADFGVVGVAVWRFDALAAARCIAEEFSLELLVVVVVGGWLDKAGEAGS